VSTALVAAALGQARREGRSWRCACPLHGGTSLSLADGRSGQLLIHCFHGCPSKDIWRELRDRGLLGGSCARARGNGWEPAADAWEAEVERIARQITRARSLYRSALPAAGTIAQVYFASRGITIPVPAVLRYLRHCPHRNGRYHPALLAPIVDADGALIGIHKTFLRSDGSGKADLPKEQQRETVGLRKGGAVRLARWDPDLPLLIAEGLESALAAMQLFDLPAWSALCADGIEALELPGEVRRVMIAADNDASSCGYHAALTAYQRWRAEGRSGEILIPPNIGDDFNNVLLQEGE
jgi:hypothetical protein